MVIDFAAPPKVRREPYLEYEFQADLASGAKVLFNDPTLSYNHLVALEINNKLLRFQLVGAQPTMTIPGDDYLVYPSVLPNVDLAYELYAGRLKEILVINSAPAQHEFSFLLETNEVTASLQPDNSIVYKDADGNTVWTIEAPYATDANGSDVPVTMQFDGAQYTVKALPTEATAYPIKLDPTVTITSAYYLLNVSEAATYTAISPVKFFVGANDEAAVIKAVEIINTRYRKITITNFTYFYDNANSYVKTYYQWFNKAGVALTGVLDLVTDPATSKVTLECPTDAYYVQFSGSASGTSSNKCTNTLRVNSFSYDDTQSTGYTTTPNVGLLSSYAITTPNIQAPANGFTYDQNGQEVTIVAAYSKGFSTALHSIYNFRDGGSYISNAIARAYDADGVEILNKAIATPSSASMSLITQVSFPAATRKVVITGTIVHSFPAQTTVGTAYLKVAFQLAAAPNGSRLYALGPLTTDVTNARVAPFWSISPVNGYKAFTSTGAAGPFAESDRITAKAGDYVYVILENLATETTATAAPILCLMLDGSAPVTVPVELIIDGLRTLRVADIALTDSVRLVRVFDRVPYDLLRSTTSGQAVVADCIRHTQASTTASADTRRTLTATELITAAMDSLRNIVVNHTAAAETKRKTISFMTIDSDSKRRVQNSIMAATDAVRRTLNSFMVASDSKRSMQQTVQAGCDTKRSAKVNIQAAADTIRRKHSSLVITSDSRRRVQKRIPFWCDTKRNSIASFEAAAETKRCLTINQQCSSDTKRSTTTSILIESDTRRSVIEALAEIIQLDTKRRILNSITSKSDLTRCILSATLAAANTKRRLTVQQALRSDSKRKVTESAQVITKAGRKVTASVLHKLDTNRKVTGYIHISYDTERNAREGLCIIYDTKRIIADRTWPRAKQCTLNIQIQGKHVTIISFKD